MDKLIEEETGGEEVLEDRLPLLGVPLSVKESYAFQGEFQKSNTRHFDNMDQVYELTIVVSNTSTSSPCCGD